LLRGLTQVIDVFLGSMPIQRHAWATDRLFRVSFNICNARFVPKRGNVGNLLVSFTRKRMRKIEFGLLQSTFHSYRSSDEIDTSFRECLRVHSTGETVRLNGTFTINVCGRFFHLVPAHFRETSWSYETVKLSLGRPQRDDRHICHSNRSLLGLPPNPYSLQPQHTPSQLSLRPDSPHTSHIWQLTRLKLPDTHKTITPDLRLPTHTDFNPTESECTPAATSYPAIPAAKFNASVPRLPQLNEACTPSFHAPRPRFIQRRIS
jgi:hypothetical protein